MSLRAGVANKATKLELTAEEKLERQTSQVGKIVRDAIKNNRSLGGKAVKSIEGVFKVIDKDGSGDLDHAEFKLAMNRLGLGLTDEQIDQCIQVLDKDGDGEVSLKEFMVLVEEKQSREQKEREERKKEQQRKEALAQAQRKARRDAEEARDLGGRSGAERRS